MQILDLMVHSLYSNKEIFLRELISNASDAIDRLRLELLSRSELPEAEGPLRIRVSYDKDAGTITVADNGIGMSREEVIANIGTIAKSGTREFLRSLTGDQRKDAAMIGQFGVGFYSSFIVAERVVLTTRRAGLEPGEGVRWESDGKGEYTLEAAERPDRGTTIVLHLRDGEDDLLNGWRLRSIIEKYSDHISVPILMPGEPEDKAEEEEDKPKPDVTVNRASALWTRPKSELTDKDYSDFYQHIAGEFTDPLAWVHAKIEGIYEYTLLLFIPSRAPYDLWVAEARRGVRLHVQRVFIMEDTGQILPKYLRFVRGVIDSSDLPLNVSREILQGSRAVDNIRDNAVKKVLRRLAELAESEPEKYATFWKEFGITLKEGIADDYSNRDEIAKLLRFTSTKSATDDPDTSLARLRGADEGGPGGHLLPAGPVAGRGQVQPAPGGVPHQGRGGPAARRGRGQLGGVQPARVRRQEAAVRRPGRRRPGRAGGRGGKAGQGAGRRRVRGAARQAEGLPGRAGLGRAPVHPAHHLAGLHRQQRARNRHQPHAAAARNRAAAPGGARAQPEAPAHPAAQPRAGRQAHRRVGTGPVQPGGAHPRRADRGPHHVRPAAEQPAHGPHRRGSRRVGNAVPTKKPYRRPTREPEHPGIGRCGPRGDGLSVNPPGRLLAVSDLHVTFPENREFVANLRPGTSRDWLLVAGDVAEKAADIEWALRTLSARFAAVVWVPGNHELWTLSTDPVQLRGEARYEHLVSMCRRIGVITPEDPFPVWRGAEGPVVIVPLFVLYDYSFRPDGTTTKAEALALAYETGIVCSDEAVLLP